MSVVRHAASLPDQGTDAGERPSLSRKSCPDRPQLEGIKNFGPSLRRQTRRTTGLGATLEGIEAETALTQPLGPLADGPGRDAHAASDLGLRQLARQEEPSGLQAAFFLLLGGQFAGLPHAAA